MKVIVQSLINIKKANQQEGDPEIEFEKVMKHPGEFIDPSEPTVLFLGTVSMKPTQYRSASAIMVFIRGHGILMDCAEGSYGQLMDHFMSNLEALNQALWKMRIVFITHIHGDHQLGIIKIMAERDKLVD